MIGRLKDTMETAVKAVSISNGVYSGIDEKKPLKGGVWCGRRDSNSHTSRRQNLNLVRLPISPRPH